MSEQFDTSDNGHNGETFVTPPTVDYSTAILSFISEVGHPVSRAEVMSELGISAKDWSYSIRKLLSSGKVLQHGAKKGAKYSLV